MNFLFEEFKNWCYTFLMAQLLLFITSIFMCQCYGQSTIPVPTLPQYGYQQREIVGLTHFNMGTYYGDSDPSCNAKNWNMSGNPINFKPYNLNISNWVESYKALGAKSAVLTSKHGCGFCLWPTKVQVNGHSYNYTSEFSSSPIKDIIGEFTKTLTAAGIGTGIYYSLKNNFYLNVIHFQIQSKILPGQQNVTKQQFEQIALAQLKELFTLYGNYTEFWFDGGTSDMAGQVKQLISDYQPTMVVYNGQGVTNNVIRWVGTESGVINGPIWSTGCASDGTGNPNGTDFCPAGCDTELQENGDWFYVNSVGLKSLDTLITVYHDTVGNNGVLELDFAIDTTGNVHPNQAMAYKQFGDWIRNCYGNTLNNTNGVITNINGVLELEVSKQFDRIMIQENLMNGQRVREFSVMIDGEGVYNGSSVGHKKIVVLKQVYNKVNTKVQLVLKQFVGGNVDVINFAVFAPCPSG
eukprot:522137_1